MSFVEDMGLEVESFDSIVRREFHNYNFNTYSDQGTRIHNAGQNVDILIPNNKTKNMAETAKKEEKIKDVVVLPELDEITPVKENNPPKDLIVISIPKMGKGSIFGPFTEKYPAIVFGLEKGGYEYIPARKLEIHSSDETTQWEAFQNYIKYRKALLDQKGKYKYLIIDGLTDLDELSVIGGTLAYMDSVIGKNFNRKDGEKLPFGHPEWKSVLSLADGAGYQHTRKWFMEQVDIFKQISPYRLYAAHVADKTIKDNGKEEVIGNEIALTGQLKRIFAAKVTSLAKLIADGDERYLNFEVANDSIIAGSRAPQLSGKILISKKEKNGKITTFWENIYEK